MEKYKNKDGLIGVLISRGFGAGWSTWNDDAKLFTMDKGLVDLCLRGAGIGEVEEYLTSIGHADACCGGWLDCDVEWISEKTHFRVMEYDGSESLLLLDDINLVT